MLNPLPAHVGAEVAAEPEVVLQAVELPAVVPLVVEAEPLELPAQPVDVAVEQREGAVTQHRRRHQLRTLRS